MGASLTPADLDRLMAAMGSDDGREVVLVVLAALDREDHLARDPAKGRYSLKEA